MNIVARCRLRFVDSDTTIIRNDRINLAPVNCALCCLKLGLHSYWFPQVRTANVVVVHHGALDRRIDPFVTVGYAFFSIALVICDLELASFLSEVKSTYMHAMTAKDAYLLVHRQMHWLAMTNTQETKLSHLLGQYVGRTLVRALPRRSAICTCIVAMA